MASDVDRAALEAHRDSELAEIWRLVRALEVQVATIAVAETARREQWDEIKPSLDALLATHQQFSGMMRLFRVLVWLVAPAVALWSLIAGHWGHK